MPPSLPVMEILQPPARLSAGGPQQAFRSLSNAACVARRQRQRQPRTPKRRRRRQPARRRRAPATLLSLLAPLGIHHHPRAQAIWLVAYARYLTPLSLAAGCPDSSPPPPNLPRPGPSSLALLPPPAPASPPSLSGGLLGSSGGRARCVFARSVSDRLVSLSRTLASICFPPSFCLDNMETLPKPPPPQLLLLCDVEDNTHHPTPPHRHTDGDNNRRVCALSFILPHLTTTATTAARASLALVMQRRSRWLSVFP